MRLRRELAAARACSGIGRWRSMRATRIACGERVVSTGSPFHCTGPRSVYDEGKRFAEALAMAYRRVHGIDVGIVRIFNTYGPRMRPDDGRVVSNFVAQALAGEDITVYGQGTQTRSFCFVQDLVRGLLAMVDSNETGPINLGNPTERTIKELAELIIDMTSSPSTITYKELPVDDPTRRRPDISLAATLLQWQPEVSLEDGLAHTIAWMSTKLGAAAGR